MNIEIDKIIRSKRRSLSISIDDKARVIVKAPHHICIDDINRFILKNYKWITDKKIKAREKINKAVVFNYDPDKKRYYKKLAREIIFKKIEIISNYMDVKFNKLRLSGAKKRWGSCSSNKNISLNWRLILTPDHVQEYVIQHELMHIKHMNHSKKFWDEIEKINPDYKKQKKWLKDNDFIINFD